VMVETGVCEGWQPSCFVFGTGFTRRAQRADAWGVATDMTKDGRVAQLVRARP
jgi:hypothetical protein